MIGGYERATHVKDQLRRVVGNRGVHDKYTMIKCPFHNDGTPSGRIAHDETRPGSVGRFKCYACAKKADWIELSEKLGLDPFPNVKSTKVPGFNAEAYDEVLLPAAKSARSEDLEFFDLNKRGARRLGLSDSEWRGFSFAFLKSVNAKGCVVVETNRAYVYLPANIKGKARGYVKGLPRKIENLPGYFNAPGAWSHKHGLLFYDEAVALMTRLGLSTLVLVEGPRDALRLLRAGIPAIAILGTQSWSKRKLEWLSETEASKIILCMDGDAAGRSATRLLYSGKRALQDGSVEEVAPPMNLTFDVEDFDLREYQARGEPELDPCSAPDRAVEDLKLNLE